MYSMSHHIKCKSSKTFKNENICTKYQHYLRSGKTSFQAAQIKPILTVSGINYKETFQKRGHK
jgi:hypothetical protein